MRQNTATDIFLLHHRESDLLSSHSEKGWGQCSHPHETMCLFSYGICDSKLVDSRLKANPLKSAATSLC